VEPGLYLTFFNEGEPMDGELPPVGPLEHVVVRGQSLIANRKGGDADVFGGGLRWIEAEQELRRATGQEVGGTTRSDLRIAAPEGVYLRFISFGEAAENDAIPELGPYAVIVIGRRGVEADGDPLATRTGTNQNLWELTGVGGSAFVGVIRPDVAFRTRSTTYHPDIRPFRTGATPAGSRAAAAPAPVAPAPVAVTAAPAVARAVDVARPQRPPEEPDPGLTLRDRIGSEPSAARSAYTVDEAAPREWAGAAWQLRYFIIGALVVLIGIFSVPSIRSLTSGGSPTSEMVTVGTAVNSPGWVYNVGNVRRVTRIGGSQARGTYLVVQMAATNRGPGAAQLSPSNFTLTATSGEQYAAQPTSSGVYSGSVNPDSAYIWPADFPIGRSVVVPLIFEVNANVSGTQLVILDVPSTRIRLE
jgi:hypothetical protein